MSESLGGRGRARACAQSRDNVARYTYVRAEVC
jgi:hypothetical protein